MLPYFGDSVASHPSRMLEPRARVSILATCSRVKGPVARGTQRFLRLSSRLLLASRPSSREKHLENFFTILTLIVLAACPGDLLVTHPSHKKRVFRVSKTIFKTIFSFPSIFCDYSLSSLSETP